MKLRSVKLRNVDASGVPERGLAVSSMKLRSVKLRNVPHANPAASTVVLNEVAKRKASQFGQVFGMTPSGLPQ